MPDAWDIYNKEIRAVCAGTETPKSPIVPNSVKENASGHSSMRSAL
jgi:hypothetical protein